MFKPEETPAAPAENESKTQENTPAPPNSRKRKSGAALFEESCHLAAKRFDRDHESDPGTGAGAFDRHIISG